MKVTNRKDIYDRFGSMPVLVKGLEHANQNEVYEIQFIDQHTYVSRYNSGNEFSVKLINAVRLEIEVIDWFEETIKPYTMPDNRSIGMIEHKCNCDIWRSGCQCGAIQPYKVQW